MTTPMTIELPDELARFVRKRATEEAFGFEQDFLERLVRERFLAEAQTPKMRETLDRRLAQGIADADAGRVLPMEQVFQELRDRLKLPVSQ